MRVCFLSGLVMVSALALPACETSYSDMTPEQRAAYSEQRAAQYRREYLSNQDSFTRAAREGDIERVRRMLEKGHPVDQLNDNGETALILATANGHTELVRLLTRRGADVNQRVDGGIVHYVSHNRDLLLQTTALMQAAANGHVEVARILIEAGARVNMLDENQSTALHVAAQGASEGGPEVIRLLMDSGADLYAWSESGSIPLMVAAINGNVENVRAMMEDGAYVWDADRYVTGGRTACGRAARAGHWDVVALFLEIDYGICTRHDTDDETGYTTLMDAAENGQAQIVEAITRASQSEACERNTDGKTALDLARYDAYPRIIKALTDAMRSEECD